MNKKDILNTEKKEVDFLESVNKPQGEGFKEEKFIYQRSNNIKWIYLIVILIILIVSTFIFLNKKIVVPDFKGASVSDAATWASKYNLIVSYADEYSDTIKIDNVISQSLDPNTKITKNSNIKFVLSKGLDPYEKIDLPDFDSSWSKTSITKWLDQYNIKNYNLKYTEDKSVNENYLISFKLIGSKKEDFTRNSEIEFNICQLEDTNTITMQSFINKTLLELDMWANENEVEYEYIYEVNSIYAENKIFYQSIKADQDMNTSNILSVKISSGTDEVTMNDMVNKTVVDADIWAKQNNIAYSLEYKYDDLYAKDRIISQSIRPAEKIIEGSMVKFIVSKGERVRVPDLSKILSSDVSQYSSDFKISSSTRYDSSHVKGDLISQSLPPGAFVEKGSDLTVTYSLGDQIYLTDYTGKDISQLNDFVYDLKQKGANISIVQETIYESGYIKGIIIAQEPFNEMIDLDEEIHIKVSGSSMITVPDFKKISEDSILDENIGLVISIVNEYSFSIPENQFISQSIKSGTQEKTGSEITVKYSLGSSLAIGDYKNKDLNDLNTWVNTQNDIGASLSINVYYEYSKSVAYGKISSTDVTNKYISIDTDIKVIISLGEIYIVTDLQSMTKDTIENYAAYYNLNIIFEYIDDPDKPADTIIGQYPAPMTKMSKTEFITVFISK